MSHMPLTLNRAVAFPTTFENNWRIRHVLSSDNNTTLLKKTQIATRTSRIATSSNMLNVTWQQNRTPNHATSATSAAATTISMTVPSEKSTSELETKHNTTFWFRNWDKPDITILSLMVAKHILAVCAPFVFNWGAFRVAVILSFFTGMGVTLGYHRLLTHRSFKVPKWLEYFFAYCGLHAGEGSFLFSPRVQCLLEIFGADPAYVKDPIFWVSIHKYHHKYSDTERDPHSPREGFWFSHIGWFHHNDYIASKCGESRSGEYSNVRELKAQWFYRFLHDTYVCHPIGLGVVLYSLGGFPYLAWGLGMREVIINHFTFLINSVCHIWGERAWSTGDTSTNNWWVALLTLGEGWHNNHHAFPSSACHGIEWWQLDLTWELIKFLEMVGLAKDVKLPTNAEKKRMPGTS